jgi:hypothetical protein
VNELIDGEPNVTTTFSEEEVEQALARDPVTKNDITLRGGEGDTFTALRVDFSEEDEHAPRDIGAFASSHRRHRLYYRGGNRSAYRAAAVQARVYPQFFQPR